MLITIPEIGDGWNVSATPDSQITDLGTGEVYDYLFWEAEYYDMNKPVEGFVVEREELETFFQEKLSFLGLSDREIADFNEFWLEQLVDYPFYKISFIPQDELDRVFPLTIEPAPDTTIRVYFVHEGLEERIVVDPQVLEPRNRTGSSAIEWGGTLP